LIILNISLVFDVLREKFSGIMFSFNPFCSWLSDCFFFKQIFQKKREKRKPKKQRSNSIELEFKKYNPWVEIFKIA
jgi:hypothetical protein